MNDELNDEYVFISSLYSLLIVIDA